MKKIPLRTCMGCSEKKPKKELIRIVKNKDGIISIDRTGKADGRGAYICDSVECFDKIVKSAWATGEPGIIFIDKINKY